MHRGGTSVVAHLIGRLGATLPMDPNPAASDNPEGYWEPAGIVTLHDRMLFAADSAWLDTRPLHLDGLGEEERRGFESEIREALGVSFGPSSCFVLKDPRICRMVPFYRSILAEAQINPRIVIALREPPEVAASLFARNQISPDYAGLLWARHLIDAERETRDLPRTVVHYNEIQRDWRGAAQRIVDVVGSGLERAELPEAMPIIRTALQHHSGASYSMFSAPLADLLRQLHDALSAMNVTAPSVTAATLDRLASDVVRASVVLADVLTVEFCFQRLTSPYDTVAAPDPLIERRNLAAALGHLHEQRWADPSSRR
jgi:hypothetical protein